MGTAGLLLVLVAIGSAWGPIIGGGISRPYRVLLFLVAGLVHLQLTSLALSFLDLEWTLWALGAGLAGQWLAVRWIASRSAGRVSGGREAGPGWGEILALLPVGALAWAASRGQALFSDYVVHWGAKARRLFVMGNVDFQWLGRDWNDQLHSEYPNLLPHLYVWTGRVRGRFVDAEMLAWSAIFFLGLLVAVRESLRIGRRRDDLSQIWIAILAFGVGAFAIGHRMAGSADWVVALGLTAAIPDLARRGNRGSDLRIGLLAALLASAKVEGVVLAGLLIAGRGLAGRDGGPGSWLRVGALTAAVVAPWQILVWRFGLFDSSEIGVPDLERGQEILSALLQAPSMSSWWGFQAVLLLLPLAFLRRRLRIPAAVVLLQLFFYLFVYLSAPVETSWLVQTSSARLAFHLIPATWVLLGLALRPRWRRAASGERPAPARTADEPPPIWDSRDRTDPLEEEWRALLRSRDLVRLWTSRNLTLRYKRSVLGVVWTLIEPLAVLTILIVVFSTVFRFDVPDYPIYLLPGWLAWDFFSKATQAMSADTVQGVELTASLDAPRSAFVVAALFTHLVNWLIANGLMVLVLLVLGRRPTLAWLAVPVGMALLSVFTLGIGLAVATANALFRDFGPLYQLSLTVWLYATPLIYPLEILPEKVRPFFLLNPLTHLVELIRAPFYEGAVAPSSAWFASAIFALGAFYAGWWIFCRSRDQVTLRA